MGNSTSHGDTSEERQHEAVDDVVWSVNTEYKGRILFLKSDHPSVNAGKLVFSEKPIFKVILSPIADYEDLHAVIRPRNHKDSSFGKPEIMYAALVSIIEGKDKVLNNLMAPGPGTETYEAALRDMQMLKKKCDFKGKRPYKQHEALIQAYSKASREDLLRMLLVWSVNSFIIGQDEGLAVYGRACLLAHSCKPNAEWDVNLKGEIQVTAREKISPSDELKISYLHDYDLLQSFATRSAKLRRIWGFECLCVQCRADQKLAARNGL